MQFWRALLLSGFCLFYGETVICDDKADFSGWIIQDIQKDGEQVRVMIRISELDAIYPGTYLHAMRKASGTSEKPDSAFIKTGLLQVEERYQNLVFASLIGEGSAESRYLFPHYPGVMIGDLVEPHELDIKQHIELLPTNTISFYDLFIDPTDHPETFELSDSGKNLLRKLAARFGSVRIPVLMIEGHTDASGRSELNQIESYQRALTIKQFLVNEMDFDADRLVALGLGESEPLPGADLPGADRKARRIVLKAVEKTSQKRAQVISSQ